MRFEIRAGLLLAAVLIGCGGGNGADSNARAEDLSYGRFDNGAVSLEYPEGWRLHWAGEGSTLAFVTRDPDDPRRQAFHFASVGPVYASWQQKQIDQEYVRMGGYPHAWLEMPVVEPLTPENFLAVWPEIARTSVAQAFMPQVPTLDQLTVVSSRPVPDPLGTGERAIVRAVYEAGGCVAEGLFCVTVAPFMPFTGAPGGGNAYGFLLCGVTAPAREFADLHDDLVHVLESFRVSPEYARMYIESQQGVWAGLMERGRTLSETSDMIMESWQRRNRSDDIVAAKRSDGILGHERLYDPDTGEVYEFENGFYDRYDLDRQRYDMSNLQPLPDGAHDLWTRAPLDGANELH